MPNYRLPAAFRENPALQQVTRLTIGQSLRCARLKLWDEEKRALVGVRDLDRVSAAEVARAAWGAGAGYDSRRVTRFLVLALPLLILTFAAGGFAADRWLDSPADNPLADYGLERTDGVPPGLRLGLWGLEAVALTGLFLLVSGRAPNVWWDGLLAAGAAWVFRGPVQILVLAAHSRLPREPWWGLALEDLALYAAGGLVLAFLARPLRQTAP